MFVKMWEDISHELNNFFRSGICVNIGKLGDAQTAGLVAILVTRGVRLDNKFRVPFDHIELVIEDLKKISSSHGTISSSAQLYCGIYEILDQPGKGKHIALDWSPFSVNPTQFHPLRPVDIESLRHKILRHILGGIAPSLVSLDGGLRKIWNKKTERKFEPPSNLLKPPFEKLEFRSPHEHSLEELLNAKSELTTKSGRYRTLYMALIENSMTEHRMKPATQLGVGACVSSLLAQYQTSLFLDYAESWRSAQMKMRNQIYRWYSGLKSASEMIALINRFLFETEAGDFPGRFCDNIHKILGALARAGDTLNFYSASVISLYEELALSLIFLVRPHEFLVPDSWRRLYFNRWENKHRSPSGRERFWYQQYLIKVCLSFCELVINIERTPTKEIALAKRSVTLIVVFNRNRLNAKGIRNLKADELIGRLAKVFREYNGNDSIILMRDRQLEQTGDSFAGFPLKGTGISVIKLRPAVEKERHLRMQSTDRETRRLNTAHILTAFWKLNGPRVLERMRERRITECNNAAHILTAFWKLNGPRVLERMRERRIRERNNAAHILTVFWKLNGPRFMERMRERRRYLAPQYKNCCLLADMKEDKNWTY
ncbi:hypothetical protein L873DRAFT_1803431 [Choiromyces venosus 120613-1]|uniref:Uncharacterized protein n=1 Tax=Choiromyces venosus 120613-1 TaxID=1336337 RepID=A0A3N4JZR4_9PEZI|nr:hypothetical protein L873DRAFT_1803431 [Choiromyces venosus 120613-1]